MLEADNLANDLQRKMAELEVVLRHPDSLLGLLPPGPYIARFDSLSSIFSFAKGGIKGIPVLANADHEISILKKQFLYSGMIHEWLTKRHDDWLRLADVNSNIIPFKLDHLLDDWQLEFEVYKQQLENWREAMKDSRNIEREVLKMLNKLPAFRDFLSRNSELARLFGPPANSGNSGSSDPLPGLQSLQNLTQDLQLRFGNNFVQPGGIVQQQLQAGMDELRQMQMTSIPEMFPQVESALPALGEDRNDVLSLAKQEQATLKAKPFGSRIEFGWNLQSAMRIQDFPAIRDIGLSLGYKFFPRGVVGVGLSYKFGLGESWKHIEWTHEGLGFRSFLDWRLTEAGGMLFKGFWLTAGFEMNYWSRIASNVQWMDLAWRKAGLLGITKTFAGKKHGGKLQILYNYLESNLPLEDRISIRWGKTF